MKILEKFSKTTQIITNTFMFMKISVAGLTKLNKFVSGRNRKCS